MSRTLRGGSDLRAAQFLAPGVLGEGRVLPADRVPQLHAQAGRHEPGPPGLFGAGAAGLGFGGSRSRCDAVEIWTNTCLKCPKCSNSG